MMQELARMVRLLRNGQITIPADFRKRLRIDEHTLLQVVLIGNELRIHPVRVTESAEGGSVWARELYDMFAPVRDEAARRTEDEVNADIDKAVASVRRKRGSRRS